MKNLRHNGNPNEKCAPQRESGWGAYAKIKTLDCTKIKKLNKTAERNIKKHFQIKFTEMYPIKN